MGVEHRRNERQTTDLSVLIKARQARIRDVSDRIKSMHEQRPGILPIHPSITWQSSRFINTLRSAP
jgi:uncharacterized protein involved in tolerance to divalent cations